MSDKHEMELYDEIIPKLMAKYHFTDKDTITDIIENIITDEIDREKFKLAIKYPYGLPNISPQLISGNLAKSINERDEKKQPTIINDLIRKQ
tara:strand:- start:1391 stop:1666 length:276 start_codon:yes stop_codon:yes gene_type:complete